MDPSQAFSGLFTTPFWVLVLIIGLIVAGFRFAVEYLAKKIAPIFPDKYEPSWQWAWRECVLPVAPLLTGGLIGYFITEYPYPDAFTGALWGRVFVSVIAGLFAAFCYPRIMFYIRKAAGKWSVEAKKVEEEVDEALNK